MGYIEETLTGDEKVEYQFSYHWIKWIFPIILCIGGLFLFFIPTLFGVYYILKIVFTEQGVTTNRGIKKVGIISRNTEELFLTKVETVEIKQGVIGRVLDYGNVYLTGTGISNLVFDTVSSPINCKKNIDSLLTN